MTEYLKDLKDTIFTYYDKNGTKQNEFNEHYRKLMNEDSTAGTFDFDNTGSINDKGERYSYADRGDRTKAQDTFDAHNKKVLGGNRETYDMADLKYSVDKGFSDQYKEIYSTPVTPPTPVPTISPVEVSKSVGSTDAAQFTLTNVTTLDSVKLDGFELIAGSYYYNDPILTIPSSVYDPVTPDVNKTLTLTVNTDKTLTAVIKIVGA